MLVVHPASLCDVCLDPYIISTEPANSPHAIACGHIFCLACLRNLSPSACPLCRKSFQPDRVKKLHVAGPPELDGATEATIEAEATQLLQRVALVSGDDVPDVEIIEVVTEVEEWLSSNSADDNSHRPLRVSLAALQRYKALQERNERDHAEYRRVRRELKAYRRNAHQDSKTSRAVEESGADALENRELSRLQAEIDSLRGDAQQPYRNASNPLPPPPEPLPLDRFPAFARPGGAADTSDPLLSAPPFPPPPPRTQSTTTATISNGYLPVTAYGGTSHTQFVTPAPIVQPLAAPRARHAEAPRGDERNRRPATQEVNGIHHSKEERRSRAESSRTGAVEARYASTDGRSQVDTGPQARRVVVAPSPAPSWAHHPLVEGGRSDEEREVRARTRTNGTNDVLNGNSKMDPRSTVDARLASAAAYIQGYGSGYGSGFQIASEPSPFAPSSYGSDQSDRVHGFPVQESPDQPIGGLGLMGVPQPIAGTVSTPDEDVTPVSRAIRLTRRNTTQAADVERSARRLGGQPHPDVLQNGGGRRAPMQPINQLVLGVRRAVTEGALRHGVNGIDDPARNRRTVSGVAAPLAGEDESPRSETTWGTVQTLSRDSFSGGSMDSLGLLVGLHNGGVRGQGSVAGESYIGHEDLGDNVTSEGGEDDETETPIITGSLPRSESDVSSLGLIREEEGEHSGTRNGRVLEDTTPRHRSTSYTERNPQALETSEDRQTHRARRSEGMNDHHRNRSQSQSSIAEALRPADGGRAVNASNITGTNALSLHFDASFPTHDYQDHAFSAPSGLQIVAPTPIVGGPNVIHLWANRA
ncbi:hypothetical protein OG21DRAFT_1490004 [Imleria badia]|nr:hypothetical protein OG21DRAFT_1490004 [Imleria badia]